MSLIYAWRKIRTQEQAWWRRVQLRILLHGWKCFCDWLLRQVYLGDTNLILLKAMLIRLTYIDYCIDWLSDRKAKLVRMDRRRRTWAVVNSAAVAAANQDSKNVYANLRALQPWKARPLPMLKTRA